jgi:hypothetical protein
METAQKCLVLIAKVTLQVPNLLMHDTILLGHTTDLLGKVLNLLGIANKISPLLPNDALSVMLQLEQVLGIVWHVCATTVVVDPMEIAGLIHASRPLWVGMVLDRVQRDRRARSSSQVLRAKGSEYHLSSLLHSIAHVSLDSPHGPRAPIRKHRVRRDIHVDIAALRPCSSKSLP